MGLFNRKTKKKHIEKFEINLINALESQMPQLRKVFGISKFFHISLLENPKSIFLGRSYSEKAFTVVNKNHKTYFNLQGVSVLNRKTKQFEPIKLTFSHDALSTITTEHPENFHRLFDLNEIQVNEIHLEHLKRENPDQKIVEKILKPLNKDQLELLELDFTFEINLDEKSFYTILDIEDGNYIAVDKKGKIYRLIHDHEQPAKVIANNPSDFFKIYTGDKKDLENIIYN
ncbi:hypothetical protein [Winogradskyella ouciana]|uniref:Uncharacterized protein n=1 Tax=Winogradskyella ouciana TaxID=2608631 RepID=A0A7K1GFS1_9FLAO|nr:hypothetical protein [Winogradskyella ouciana]MTE27324.1 hypothetical protein [Winogradskyella ouciana]